MRTVQAEALVHSVTGDQIKMFRKVPKQRVTAFLKRSGWRLLPNERSESVWVIEDGGRESLCTVCDGARGGFDVGIDPWELYCPQHEDPVAALVHPSRGEQGAEAVMRALCSQNRMTPEDLLNALTLERRDEAHLYLRSRPFEFPVQAEVYENAIHDLFEILYLCYDCAGAEQGDDALTYSDVTFAAPDHVVLSFGRPYAEETGEAADRVRTLSRRAAEQLGTPLNWLHSSQRDRSVVRQYATGELVLEEVVEPEDFRAGAGPERALWDALDTFRYQTAFFADWRFDWGWDVE
ncbi:hypothetical protein [Streptomyces sp. NPDC002265]|uniref:hypothetical protein n=1 Tax=Streptomyces sp. NPDC002265 TaxID=3154415 RepID=UPI003330AD2B